MPRISKKTTALEGIEVLGRRNEILRKAEQVLGKTGVAGFELKLISQELNVSASLINHYFKTTEELIFETVLFSYSKTVYSIQDKCLTEQNPEKVLRIWVESMMSWLENLPGIGVILEYPEQVLRRSSKSSPEMQKLYKNFRSEMNSLSQQNVFFMASAVRCLQKGSKFQRYNGLQIASFMKIDSRFAAQTSLLGFSTMGAALWIAGRKPADKKSTTWSKFGFDPTRQTQQTIDHLIASIKS